MKGIYVLLTVIGWVMAVSATFVWAGKGIYDLTQGVTFWEAVLPNLGFWFLQLVVGLLLTFFSGISAVVK
ncbi:TMhelix containing protein [Vibrio phage 1.170.O._10N.261.52.C3]|nr:TMhelix containing protein [Vibrio phage 1.170.O._10N.261.52.C3]